MDMGERIKKLRKELNLTQTEFAEKLGSVQNTITRYETGNRTPSSSVISLICHKFNVSETWLRNGKGEMFNQSVENTIDRLCTELHASELESGIIHAYFRIDPRIREPFMQCLIQEMQVEYVAVAPVSVESDKSELVQATEPKMPTPVSEDGLDDSPEFLMKYMDRLNPDQQQMILDQEQKMITPQTELSADAALPTTDETAPKSELPDQS